MAAAAVLAVEVLEGGDNNDKHYQVAKEVLGRRVSDSGGGGGARWRLPMVAVTMSTIMLSDKGGERGY